jgi:acyl-CoA synthetase (AMP-forming)/AMP-acid ligase II
MNLLQPIFIATRQRRAQTAIIAPTRSAAVTTTTFGELMTSSGRLAAAWRRRGIKRGDRVLVALPLGIPLYVSLIALWHLGAVAVLPEPALGLSGIRHALAICRPDALLASGRYRALGLMSTELWMKPWLSPDDRAEGEADIDPVDDDHPALISFTSGSTGRPKTIVRSHGFLKHQSACVEQLIRPETGGEIDLVAFPVFVLANLALGVTSVLPNWNVRKHDEVDPASIASLIELHHITRAMIPPSVCERLCEGPRLPLKTIFTGGGPVFPDMLENLAAVAPDASIVAVYGSTEAEPIAHLHLGNVSRSDFDEINGGGGLLVGRPVSNVQVKLVDDEILVAGDHVNKSYLDPADNQSTKVAIDGVIWHRTGDAGRFDAQGRLWLLGRIAGKTNGLFPFCVETASRRWPGVKRSALVDIRGRAYLAVEGDSEFKSRWQAEADRIGNIRVVPVTAIPLDRRHRSKIDYQALKSLLLTD